MTPAIEEVPQPLAKPAIQSNHQPALRRLFVTRPADFRYFHKEAIAQGIHQRIEQQAALLPHNIALKTADASCSYRELNGFANSIAAEILSIAGTELAQVGILQPNSPGMIVSIVACMKARKAYVPLDPTFPKSRLQIMLEDSDPVLLLTDDEHSEFARELAGPRTRILNVDRIRRYADAANPGVHCDPLDRAYILYTSGSTGRPKGIAFLHRNLLHTTMCLTNELFFSPSDRVTWLHSASFSASVVDIYCALMNGATLYPWDAKHCGFTGLADWIAQQRVTTFQWIPSAFRQFLRTVPADFVFENIRIVVMASEPLTIREVELFRRHFPHGSHIVNQVGTSESYNYRLCPVDHRMTIPGATVPGGYAVSEDREVVILDDNRRPLPMGETGEIGIRSDYMSAGYWGDEALTRQKFVHLDGDSVPVYLTGDLGRLEPDGCLMHGGRKDSQVKIRGYRVELAEVDHVLSSAPGVADSATAVVKNRMGADQLVGYIVLAGGDHFRQREVAQHVSSRLPDYMVPREYVVMNSLPTLPAGKIDRNALPNPFQAPEVARTRVEQELTELFSELLHLQEVGPDLNFLNSGADSLTTAVLMARIQKSFGIEIRIDDFLASPTVAHLAKLIQEPEKSARRQQAPSVIGHRPSQPSREPFGTKDLIIVGAGMLGREAANWAMQAIAAGSAMRLKGFLDIRPDILNGFRYDIPIVGSTDTYEIQEGDVFLSAIGNPKEKRRACAQLLNRGARFMNLIHPLAVTGQNVDLGTGVLLSAFTSVTCDARVGNHVDLGTFSNLGHDTGVGDWCHISSHCGLNGGAVLEEGVFLGSHVCVLPGVRIGAWAYVGAGSVVARDVAPGTKVFGNPAVEIGRVNP